MRWPCSRNWIPELVSWASSTTEAAAFSAPFPEGTNTRKPWENCSSSRTTIPSRPLRNSGACATYASARRMNSTSLRRLKKTLPSLWSLFQTRRRRNRYGTPWPRVNEPGCRLPVKRNRPFSVFPHTEKNGKIPYQAPFFVISRLFSFSATARASMRGCKNQDCFLSRFPFRYTSRAVPCPEAS